MRVNRVLRSFKLADELRAHASRLVRALGGAGGFLALRLAPLPPMVDGGDGDSGGGTAWGALEMAAWRARLQRVLQSAPFAAAVARAGETAPIVFVAVESSAGVSCHDELFQPLSDAGLRLECIPPPAPPTQEQEQHQQQQQRRRQERRRRRPPTQSAGAAAVEANSLPHDLVVAAVAAQSAAFVGSKSDPISRLVHAWCNGTWLCDNDVWVV